MLADLIPVASNAFDVLSPPDRDETEAKVNRPRPVRNFFHPFVPAPLDATRRVHRLRRLGTRKLRLPKAVRKDRTTLNIGIRPVSRSLLSILLGIVDWHFNPAHSIRLDANRTGHWLPSRAGQQ